MLVPLTREKLEQLLPLIATAEQYAYYWGKWQDLLNRLLISVVAVVVILILSKIVGEGAQAFVLLLWVIAGLYWLWAPVYQASVRNTVCRRFKYGGFWQGKILDVYLTEELIGEEETVNKRGELVIIENRERWINLVLGDEMGFEVEVQTPLRRIHKGIVSGQIAELLILSNRSDLGRVEKITDAYIPRQNLWIGQYPYLQRDIFTEVSRQVGGVTPSRFNQRTRNRSSRSRSRNIKRRY